MKVVMANDHGAVGLKKRLCAYLTLKGISVVNLGTDDETAVDYPDMAEKACAEYLTGGYDFGILLCGTGIGMSIAANKIDGIRAALPQNAFAARMAKEHNNADFLVFGGRIDYVDSPEMMIDAFIGAEFAGGRHLRRIEKTTNAATGFKHIVMWSFKSSLTEDEKKSAFGKIKTELEALNGRIPGLLSLKVRSPLPASSTGDILLESILTDENALAIYQTHPDHLKAADFIRSVTENRVCADFFL